MPHPLHDNLSYVARDYERYAGKAGKGQKDTAYALYCRELGAWAENPAAPAKVKAVYHYITHNDLIDDLCTLATPLLYRDAAGRIIEKWAGSAKEKPALYRVAGSDILKSFVRFRVENGDGVPNLWEDRSLQESYSDYIRQRRGEIAICYATGREMILTNKQGRGLRFPGDTAKLISVNDNDGYTFRGRFDSALEAVAVGYESSQKAMNALQWLIRNQGYSEDGKVFLAWSNDAAIPPLASASSASLIRRRHGSGARPGTLKGWADNLGLALAGYRHDLTKAPNIKVNIIILDAATTGRLSICYYDELSGRQFMDRVERWHTVGAWRQHRYSSEAGKSVIYYGVPAPREILAAAYGDNISTSRRKLELERLLCAIAEGRPLPPALGEAAYRRTLNRAAIIGSNEKRYSFLQLLEPTCTLIAKRLNDKGEEYTVALDEQSTNRSYLYGRMLAVADRLERATYTRDDDKRVTNAMKYMEVLALKPATTWMNIQQRLLPYEQKREQYGGRERKLIAKIGSLFSEEDFTSNRPLDSRFLLGYYAQSYAIDQEIEQRRQAQKEREIAAGDLDEQTKED